MKPSKYDETATTKTPETPKTRVENCYPTKQQILNRLRYHETISCYR